MKKIFLFMIIIFTACSFCFAGNIGDYTVKQITDSNCKKFVEYLYSKGYFDPTSEVVIPDYGFFKTDDGDWQVRISDFSDYSMFNITFYDNSVSIIRWANFDLSGSELIDILSAINDASYNHTNYGTVGFDVESGDLYYASRITNQLNSEALMDQIYWVGITCDEVFTEIFYSL